MLYLGCILVFCLLSILMDTFKCDKIFKQLFYGVTVIAFIFLATFRSLDFPDTSAYVDFYNSQIGEGLFAPKNSQYEWGFVLLTRLCLFITNDYRLLFFAQALIVNIIAVVILKKSDSKMLLYACFLSFYGIYTTFIILRAGLSIAFFALGVMKYDDNWIMRIFCFALAILFHMSAIVMVAVYLLAYTLKNINLKAEYLFLVLIVLLVCFASGISKEFMIMIRQFLISIPNRNLFIAKALGYLAFNIETFEFGLSFRYLLNTMVFLLALYTVQKHKINLSKTLRVNMIFIFMGLCLESLLGNMRLIGRLTDFCNILNIYSVGIVVKNNIERQCEYVNLNVGRSAYLGEIRGLQCYNLALGVIFVCLNLIFMYRIVY